MVRFSRSTAAGLLCGLALVLVSGPFVRAVAVPVPPPRPTPPQVSYSVEGPELVVGTPSAELSWSLDVVVTVDLSGADGSDPDPNARTGVSSWEFSIVAIGVDIVDISLSGTVGARVDDEPPGLREIVGFERSELGRPDASREGCFGRSSAVSAVVLSLITDVSLPLGRSRVARLTVRGELPPLPGVDVPGRLEFVDGCVGSGMAVGNYVSWDGATLRPAALRPLDFIVRAERAFLRGDTNDDGRVRLADAVSLLNCKFRGVNCSVCRDADDVNDDGFVTLSDAISVLNFLYRGGPPPAPPGPYECGVDTSEDAIEPCQQMSCLSPTG